MVGDACTRSTSDAASTSVVEIAARIAPCSRSRNVRRRVSIPSIPTTFAARSSSARLPSARQLDVLRDASRTTNPDTCTRADSASSRFTP